MREAALIRKGYAALNKYRFEEATTAAGSALKKDSNSVRAHCLKALSLHESGRIDEAFEHLRSAEAAASKSHFPHLLRACFACDLKNWRQALAAIEAARSLSKPENFIVSDLKRLILLANGEGGISLGSLCKSPGIYNVFVGPRLLLFLEEQIFQKRNRLNLEQNAWARLELHGTRKRRRSLRTHIPFVFLRMPVVLFLRMAGRPTMPLAAEEAYLRGDSGTAREVTVKAISSSGRRRRALSEYAAALSLDLGEFTDCLNYLPRRSSPPNPQHEFFRGYCLFHLQKWRKAEKCLAEAEDQPMACYFHGLCYIALGKTIQARKAFTREIQRNDLGVAERVIAGGRILEQAEQSPGGRKAQATE